MPSIADAAVVRAARTLQTLDHQVETGFVIAPAKDTPHCLLDCADAVGA